MRPKTKLEPLIAPKRFKNEDFSSKPPFHDEVLRGSCALDADAWPLSRLSLVLLAGRSALRNEWYLRWWIAEVRGSATPQTDDLARRAAAADVSGRPDGPDGGELAGGGGTWSILADTADNSARDDTAAECNDGRLYCGRISPSSSYSSCNITTV